MAAADDHACATWARSGAMALTGRADGPALGPPEPLVERLEIVAGTIAARSSELGTEVRPDPCGLLAERAALASLRRRGTTSCGGSSRLLRTADAWIAVTLARHDDVELVPAWLGERARAEDQRQNRASAAGLDAAATPRAGQGADGAVWEAVERAVARARSADLVAQATLLGLPVSVLPPPSAPTPPDGTSAAGHGPCETAVPAVADSAGTFGGHDDYRLPGPGLPCRTVAAGDGPRPRELADLLVVDLSALWAGPLAGSILCDAGAMVVKVESTLRPDGARRGPRAFFDLMNAGKRSVAIDLGTDSGWASLRALVAGADVVIEGSRPRALEQHGIDAAALLGQENGPQVWISITGYGRRPPGRDRVGFGDDTAVGGGLVAWEHGEPRFCADAIADPCAGLVAAAACLTALAVGGRWLIDIPLAGVAAHLAGRTLPVPSGTTASPPRPHRQRGRAAELGAHTAAVLGLMSRRR